MFFKKISQHLAAFGLLSALFFACTAKEKSADTNLEQKNSQEATYLNCAVYASSTSFYFKSTQGDTIQFSVLNEGEIEAETSAKVPKGLIEDGKDLEGLPGANPEMVGKKFTIIFDKEGQVIEVKKLD